MAGDARQVDGQIAELAQWFKAARSVAVLTGAGMSAESGIPIFRDAQNGLWLRFDPEDLATARAYQKDKALV
jgi:NAD-dependent deacetylase